MESEKTCCDANGVWNVQSSDHGSSNAFSRNPRTHWNVSPMNVLEPQSFFNGEKLAPMVVFAVLFLAMMVLLMNV